MNIGRMGAIAGTLLLLAGIAGASSPFDGTYRGGQTTIRTNNSQTCANMDRNDVVIRIVDGRFTRNWGVRNSGGDTIELVVQPDGSFKGDAAALSDRTSRSGTRTFSMTGRIAGGTLEAEIGSNLCAVRMLLRKS